MKGRRWLRVVCLIILAVAGFLIYADLRSVHQIFQVTEKVINDAPDAQLRGALVNNKNTRDREERRHKTLIEVALAVDVALFLWVGISVRSWPTRAKRE